MIHRRAQEIANEIRMKRSQFNGVFLLVEGSDDWLFMQKFISPESCRIEVARGKGNVCSVISILDEDGFEGVLGVVDADFDRINGLPSKSPNLVMPECHDLVTMLVYSPALDRMLIEFGSEKKIASFTCNESVLSALTSRALLIGYLRLYSLRADLNLKFKKLTYSKWIKPGSFEPNIVELTEAVKNNSQRLDLATCVLVRSVEELCTSDYDPREICNGADLVEILSIGLRSVLGSNNAKSITPKHLKKFLRLAYSDQDFSASTLKKEILKWQSMVPRFRVLNES